MLSTRRGLLVGAAAASAVTASAVHAGKALASVNPGSLGLFVDDYLPAYASNVDCSTGFQNALNAASAIGSSIGVKCPLYCTPGRNYLISRLIPASYVDLLCYGSRFQRNANYTPDTPILYSAPDMKIGAPVTQFGVKGATLSGTGRETPFQGLMLIAQATFLEIEDCFVKDTAGIGFYIADCQNVWVRRNKLINVAAVYGGANVINLVSSRNGAATPLKHIWCEDNLIQQALTLGIAICGVDGSTRTDPVVDAHITGNTIEMSPASKGAWPIAIEQGGKSAPPNLKRVDISGNTCIQNGSSSGSLYGICLTNNSSVPTTDPLCMSEVTITGNRVVSSGAGILDTASRSSITGNTIIASTDDIKLAGAGNSTIGHITISGNSGHVGSGKPVNILNGVDKTTVSIGQ